MDSDKQIEELILKLKEMPQINYDTVSNIFILCNKVIARKNNDYVKMDSGTIVSLVLEFFKSISQEYYIKAIDVIYNADKIRVYDANNIDSSKELYSSITDKDGFVLFDTASVVRRKADEDWRIYIPCFGNGGDIYTFVHEIAHTFNNSLQVKGDSFLEVIPFMFEALLDDFLISNGYDDIVSTHQQSRRNDVYFYAQDGLGLALSAATFQKNKEFNKKLLSDYIFSKKDFALFMKYNSNNIDDKLESIIKYSNEIEIEKFIFDYKYMLALVISANFKNNYNFDNFSYFVTNFELESDLNKNNLFSKIGIEIDNYGNILNFEDVSKSFEDVGLRKRKVSK